MAQSSQAFILKLQLERAVDEVVFEPENFQLKSKSSPSSGVIVLTKCGCGTLPVSRTGNLTSGCTHLIEAPSPVPPPDVPWGLM